MVFDIWVAYSSSYIVTPGFGVLYGIFDYVFQVLQYLCGLTPL